ncbi:MULTISPECIES: Sec-independent protein translocase protein TatB [Methylomonas]|uniref:Sec-independent protein translocase protein TatB n=2 Tax=Methylomonas TaxID=416 RepID=A0A126T425_9GAMM|nr:MULTISPECIES: Sec-independent protein translocase protein TatB [Methylomonas]AMK76810.1 preprotein translocase subunit TatB [Methylomonas denitrificans]OAI03425.1 twin arginine-targeting protein translocase TatB [Methylomonas methanica]TCV76928.1 sec-independent protein translocase protein TatB [Methylomonas methanica]
MFDVGFSELLMVGLVALLVLGPEKLPKAARLAGLWVGKARTVLATAKAEIKQELHAEEMRQLMQQQSIAGELEKVVQDTQSALDDINFNVQAAAEINQDDDKSTTAG